MKIKLTKDQILQIPTLRRDGLSNGQIMAKLGVPRTTLDYWIKRLRASQPSFPAPRRPGRPRLDLSTKPSALQDQPEVLLALQDTPSSSALQDTQPKPQDQPEVQKDVYLVG